MFRPIALLALLVSTLFLLHPRTADAQDGTVWLQVEAHPDLATATDRARAYATLFPETAGFRLRSGWYGVALGPYPADEATLRLNALKREGQVPSDSFIAYSRDFGEQFWPEAGAPTPVDPAPDVTATVDPTIEPAVEPEPVAAPDESKAEARDSEALLPPEDRKELQTALQWFGFYSGGIDGAFGPGTRNSMAAWQEANAADPTGILTTRQRRMLLDDWKTELSTFGFAEVVEPESGIAVTLPLGLVEFDHYEPPFVHYRSTTADAPRILLISQPGDQAALYGLYDVLQTLESVPLEGARDRDDRSFRIRGTSSTTDTTVFASLQGDRIKGWMLISAPGNDARDGRIRQVLENTFNPDGDSVLDPGMVAMDAGTKAGLLSGLEVRKPKFSRTGFFVSPEGVVLTTVEAVTGCSRVSIDRATDATITLSDAASGLAVLTPKSPLSPRAVAGFATTSPRPGSEVTVPGYSYEDRLPAPTLTFGTLEDLSGLNGETALNRLSLQSLPGDTGAPILDARGAVLGMLLPASPQGGKQLPAGVAFALTSAEIMRLTGPTGVAMQSAVPTGTRTPAELAELATGMTALVSCWE